MGRLPWVLFLAGCGVVPADPPPPCPAVTPRLSCAPGPAGGPARVVGLAVGGEHTCTLDEYGAVCCWGANGAGQLGDGSDDDRVEPVVVGLPRAHEVAAGGDTTCARVADGAVYCWGDNGRGQLGDGTLQNRAWPRAVVGLTQATAIAVGPRVSCAIVGPDGGLRCWGGADFEQPAGTTGVTLPIAIPVPEPVVSVVSGGEVRVLTASGRVYAFPGITPGATTLLTTPPDLTLPASRVATSCTVGTGGRLQGCRNPVSYGDVELEGVADVATCSDRACAVLVDGTVHCWGENARGELGFTSKQECQRRAPAKLAPVGPMQMAECAPRPQNVRGVAGAVDVGVGNHHACALLRDGTATCWGIVPPEIDCRPDLKR